MNDQRVTHSRYDQKTPSFRLLRDNRGLSTVEYIIILVLIAVVGIGAWSEFGSTVKKKIDGAKTKVGSMGSE